MKCTNIYKFVLVSLLSVLCKGLTSQKGGFEHANQASFWSFSSMEDRLLQLDKTTWLTPLHAESPGGEFVDARGATRGRPRRSVVGSYGAGKYGASMQIAAYQPGDFILGGMFAVLIPDGNQNPCSKVLKLTGLRMESMMYAVDVINNRSDVLPGIKLGFDIRNDCSNPNRALTEALSFLTVTGEGTCSDNKPQTIGVVGTGSSTTSTGVANLLGLFKVPQVSYSASSPVLSNKKLYPYFLRTTASDTNQVQVMADLAGTFGWNYVAIVFTNDNYGTSGMELLSDLLEARNVCVAHMFSLNRNTPDSDVAEIVAQLSRDTKISVIFTFCLKHDIRRVLEEASSQGMMQRTWIASDSWGQSLQTVEGVETVVQGMLGIIPKSRPDENFKRYLANLNPYLNTRNPWYQLTLGELFNCTFDQTETRRAPCMGTETFSDIDDTYARFVIDAVFALAYGLHNMLTDCTDCLNGTDHLDLEAYLEYVRNVNFTGLTNPNFMFDANGDPMAQYEIHNLQHINGKYSFIKVADWDPTLKFSEWQNVKWQTGRAPPVSRCSQDCPSGGFITLEMLKCCWECHQCEAGSISTSQNSLQCTECLDGERTNHNQTTCLVNPIVYLEWGQATSIVLIVLTGIGLLVTGFTLAVYIRHRNSATIKATSTELSYVLLVGIALSYSTTFLFIGVPTDEICSARIITVGTSFSVYVGALLTKTNRISRIFNRKLSDGRPSMFLSIQYQLMFALGIVIIQVALQVISLQVEPGSVVMDTGDPKVTFLECQYSSYLGPGVAIGFNAFLASLCLYKAFRTRKLPGQFNDSRGIGFAMLTCSLIWFIFFTCYFTTTGLANSIVCSLAFIASGTSGLVCMFAPKLWIVIMRPELNVRQSTLKMKSSSGSGVTIKTISSVVKKTSDSASLTPVVVDMTPSSSHSSDTDADSGNSRGSNDSDSEREFLQELDKMEKELKMAETERDDAVTDSNKMYQEMLDLQKIQEAELRKLDEDIKNERNNLRRLLEVEGMREDVIDKAMTCQELDQRTDEKETECSDEVNELATNLATALAERDRLGKQVKGLKQECQHWRSVVFPNGNIPLTSSLTTINLEQTADSYSLTKRSKTVYE